MDSKENSYTSFRWVVLGVAWLAMVGMGWVLYLTPALAYDLVPDLGLTPTQVTLIFTAPMLMGIFFNITGGALGDRYGIRPVVTIAIVLAGLGTLIRAWVSSFAGLFVLSCLFGIGNGVAFPNLPKLVAVWFPPKEAGLASGIYFTGLMVGVGVGLVTSSYFGGWRAAFLYTGIVLTGIAFLWLLLARNTPRGVEKIETPSVIDGLKVAIKKQRRNPVRSFSPTQNPIIKSPYKSHRRRFSIEAWSVSSRSIGVMEMKPW